MDQTKNREMIVLAQYVAFYLPQFHPIPENSKWYGEGFTEWTNVAAAKPLFKGHYQPHIPADLGFYDLRLPESRRAQAKMAQQYGVSAFCYWTYWFGGGKKLLDYPIWEVYKDKSITLPFCLAWANHSWEKKTWTAQGKNVMLMEQKYLGEKDYSDFFYQMLPLFRDERYFKVDGKLFFSVFQPLDSPEIERFIQIWRELGRKEGLHEFLFVGRDMNGEKKDRIIKAGFDCTYADNVMSVHHELSTPKKALLLMRRKLFRTPTVFHYQDAIKTIVTESAKDECVFPTLIPNWDHSPRSGRNAVIVDRCEPKYFGELIKRTLDIIKGKPEEMQVVMIKSWNEWGEGNHLEPDLKYGKGYLEEIRRYAGKRMQTGE